MSLLSTSVYLTTRLRAPPSDTVILAEVLYTYPKTLPISYNAQPTELLQALQNVPEMGRLWVERTPAGGATRGA